MPFLIAFSGLPGVGKSTIAKDLSGRLPAFLLRVDAVEAALKRSVLHIHPAEDAGYLALAAIAAGNLELGHNVVADTVNPVAESRQLWRETAQSTGATLLNVEIVCSDEREHRKRVESRETEIDGLTLPRWPEVRSHEFEPWTEPCLQLDSSSLSVGQSVDTITKALTALRQNG
ncbi:AAA family ATPase [Roseibium sp. RP-7]|uniref:AAA family ATPase n=1 Tax=Roseibium aggregatum TaxID=187304 RepID=UPI001E4220AC|nr:AAA family ATPase [Roseibium aggregatum]UES45142.1 AAA family ATPase [Roseibium aggregatum]